jgi:predicted dehydrogenase
VPVVVEKPAAVTAADAEALVELAGRAGVMLTVFQNRRWDESRFERWRPTLDPTKSRENLSPAEGGGVLLDLGVHLIDQAIALFGPVAEVYAEIDSRRGAPAEDDVFVALHHASGTISHLHASAVTPSPGPRLRVQGTNRGFLVPHLDPQEAALGAGPQPETVDDWGRPEQWDYGRLIAGERSVPMPPGPGDWPRFY